MADTTTADSTTWSLSKFLADWWYSSSPVGTVQDAYASITGSPTSSAVTGAEIYDSTTNASGAAVSAISDSASSVASSISDAISSALPSATTVETTVVVVIILLVLGILFLGKVEAL